jgi:hypothetical protein
MMAFQIVVICLEDDTKTEQEGYDLDARAYELLKKQVHISLRSDYIDTLNNHLKQHMAEYGGTMVEIGAVKG